MPPLAGRPAPKQAAKPPPRKPVISTPSRATLRRYGLTATEWLAFLKAQGGVCAICEGVPKTGFWVTDHEHVAKWKKMPPEQRKRYVRGVICSFCNSHVLSRFVTLKKARNVVGYLVAYEERKAGT